MKKNILVISQYFYPEQFRINDICLELVKRGYKVTVLTGIPNYPEGKFYKGYSLFSKRSEVWNDINIIRIPLISRGKSTIRLIINYYSFAVSGWFWSHLTKLNPDLIFTFEVSPMIQALIGKWFAKRKSIPNYLYVQDLWPENLDVVGGIHNKLILNHYQKMSDKIYESSTKIFATSPSFVKTIQERVIDKEKVLYLPQYAETFYVPLKKEKTEIPDNGKIKVIFTGNVGEAQGLDILPKVAKACDNNIQFVIVGDGRYKEQLIKETAEVKEKFVFINKKPAVEIPKLLASCDIAFVSFMSNPLFEKTIPAKLQSYMACGKPILAVASGETKRIVEESQSGICCEKDVEMIVQAIKEINKNKNIMSQNAINYYQSNFNKDEVFNTFIGHISL